MKLWGTILRFLLNKKNISVKLKKNDSLKLKITRNSDGSFYFRRNVVFSSIKMILVQEKCLILSF